MPSSLAVRPLTNPRLAISSIPVAAWAGPGSELVNGRAVDYRRPWPGPSKRTVLFFMLAARRAEGRLNGEFVHGTAVN